MKLPLKRLTLFILPTLSLLAGPYAPPAGQEGSTAIAMDSADILYWASTVIDYQPGTALDSEWTDTNKALGAAEGEVYSIVSLGRGGSIILSFPEGISNGSGWDFAIFENAFDDYFLELAYVAVSSDGQTFVTIPSYSLTESSISAYGQVDATNIHNLAGKYRLGYGTPFDLDEVKGDNTIDLGNIRYVLITDIPGDGSVTDTEGNTIYDPYPTTGSAGFDLDAAGVRYPRTFNSVKPDGNVWSYAESIGWYVGASFPWIYQQQQGWWYVTGNEVDGLWIWDRALGWLWTKAGTYPSLFSTERNGWIYFGALEGDRRYFVDFSDGEWFSEPKN